MIKIGDRSDIWQLTLLAWVLFILGPTCQLRTVSLCPRRASLNSTKYMLVLWGLVNRYSLIIEEIGWGTTAIRVSHASHGQLAQRITLGDMTLRRGETWTNSLLSSERLSYLTTTSMHTVVFRFSPTGCKSIRITVPRGY